MPRKGSGKPIEERVYKGRPVQDVALAVFARMEAGESLRQACDKEDVTRWAVMKWADESEELGHRYAHARNALLEYHAAELERIADESGGDVILDDEGRSVVQHDVIQRAKLRIDTRKWILSKLAPKTFGDRTTLAGDPKAPLAVVAAKPLAQMTDDDWEREHGEA